MPAILFTWLPAVFTFLFAHLLGLWFWSGTRLAHGVSLSPPFSVALDARTTELDAGDHVVLVLRVEGLVLVQGKVNWGNVL